MSMSLAQQIEEIDRELALRRSAYPRFVSTKKMRQSVADFHMGRMEAVLKTLLWLQANEDKVKARVKGDGA